MLMDETVSLLKEAEVEGGEKDPIDLGAFPIDSLMIRTETRSVFEVCRRIESGMFVLNPDFQREFVWKEPKLSKLIESCLLRIPLPVFYLAETKDGKVIIVDGLQRLTTFYDFLKGEFKLRGLGFSKDVNGRRFEELPPTLKTRIEDTPLTLYLIDSKVPDEARYEIFERVNGGVPLTRQQMRNCIYTGPATAWLREMAETLEFKSAIDSGLNTMTMRDRECINRFAAFRVLGLTDYNGKMDAYLGKVLAELNRRPNLNELTAAFLRSMRINSEIFGANAFRRSMNPAVKRSIINVALFDVMTTEFADWDENHAMGQKDGILAVTVSLLSDPAFVEAISRSTNSATNVKQRFTMYREALSPFRA
jgi:hypothetical protein